MADMAPPSGPQAAEDWTVTRPRLAPFLEWRETNILEDIGPISPAPWPAVDGCLIVLFTARSGSTFLTRELEVAFDLGKISESLNPAKLNKRSPQKKVAKVKGAWFAAKTGVPGVVGGELCGFFDAYLSKTHFLRLLRKDIVAQAVSTAKAVQTREWHQYNRSEQAPEYDMSLIAKSVAKIERSVAQLRQYAALTGRPCRPLLYEDFANGDLTPALNAARALGAPPRPPSANVLPRPVERAGDKVNEAWIARFNEDCDDWTRGVIARYKAAIEAEV